MLCFSRNVVSNPGEELKLMVSSSRTVSAEAALSSLGLQLKGIYIG